MKTVDQRPDWEINNAISKITFKMLEQVKYEQASGCSLERALARAIHDNLLKHIRIIHCVNDLDRYIPPHVAEQESYIHHMKKATMHKFCDALDASNGLLLYEYDCGYHKIFHYTLAIFDLDGKD